MCKSPTFTLVSGGVYGGKGLEMQYVNDHQMPDLPKIRRKSWWSWILWIMEDRPQTTPNRFSFSSSTISFACWLVLWYKFREPLSQTGKDNPKLQNTAKTCNACPHNQQIMRNLAWAEPDLGLHCSHSWLWDGCKVGVWRGYKAQQQDGMVQNALSLENANWQLDGG
jgi:hypothetical protein